MTGTDTAAIIAGVDEAGRGPLAGPVVAAACILSCALFRRRHAFPAWSPYRRRSEADCLIADSKRLSPEERETAFAWITTTCPYGVASTSAADIDRIGILAATERAMQEAIAMLAKTLRPTYLLVDGRDAFWFDYPHSSIVRGDHTEPAIAAASIIAKVTRDRWMCAQASEHPLFGFERHKGYATEEHLRCLREHGPCALHRRTFIDHLVAGPLLASPPATTPMPPPSSRRVSAPARG